MASIHFNYTFMSASILVLNGPNLNLLGRREPHIYGHTTLDDINQHLTELAHQAGLTLESLQSNAESVLIDRIQAALDDDTRFILINPGAFTHTSIAIRDAFAAVAKPFIEIHISNVHAREPFRRHSYLSNIAQGVICGLGIYGYEAALHYAMRTLKQQNTL